MGSILSAVSGSKPTVVAEPRTTDKNAVAASVTPVTSVTPVVTEPVVAPVVAPVELVQVVPEPVPQVVSVTQVAPEPVAPVTESVEPVAEATTEAHDEPMSKKKAKRHKKNTQL